MSGLFTASWLANGEFGGVLLSHGECHTIIGAKAFHGPVRDGKAWDHLAMATKHQAVNQHLPEKLDGKTSGKSKAQLV